MLINRGSSSWPPDSSSKTVQIPGTVQDPCPALGPLNHSATLTPKGTPAANRTEEKGKEKNGINPHPPQVRLKETDTHTHAGIRGFQVKRPCFII